MQIEASFLLLDHVDEGRLNDLWLRGGLPESLSADSDRTSMDFREYFLNTHFKRDIQLLAPRIHTITLRRFWTILAYDQGGLQNVTALAKFLDVSGPTVSRYLKIFADLGFLRLLRPWSTSDGKRLVKSPKVYIRDSGFVHALLSIVSLDTLLDHAVVSSSWEGFCLENLIYAAPNDVKFYFYQSSAGTKVDLVLQFSTMENWAIEIKRTTVPKASLGFYTGANDIKASQKILIYLGEDIVHGEKNLCAMPLAKAMRLLQNRP